MVELKSVKVIHLLMTTPRALRQLHCLSTRGIWTPAQGPRKLKVLGRLVWLEAGLGTPCVRLETATLSNINLWLGGEVMVELKSVKVIHLLMTTWRALRQFHCLSARGIWTPAQGPRKLKVLGRLVWLEAGLGTPCVRLNSNQQVHTAVQQYIQYTILCNHVARNSVLLAESVDTTFPVHHQEEELLEEIPPVWPRLVRPTNLMSRMNGKNTYTH